jgi:hypothetical protein
MSLISFDRNSNKTKQTERYGLTLEFWSKESWNCSCKLDLLTRR